MHFPDELFAIIKEFAGIYHIGTKINISKLGVDKLHDFYKDNFKKRLTNYKKNPAITKKMIMNYIRFKMNEPLWEKLHLLCNPFKPIIILKGKIGEEVKWHLNGKWYNECCAGIIVGHYKKSYKIKRYTESREITEREDGYTTTKYTFIKDVFEDKTYNVKDVDLYSEEHLKRWPFFNGFEYRTTEYDPNR